MTLVERPFYSAISTVAFSDEAGVIITTVVSIAVKTSNQKMHANEDVKDKVAVSVSAERGFKIQLAKAHFIETKQSNDNILVVQQKIRKPDSERDRTLAVDDASSVFIEHCEMQVSVELRKGDG